MVRPNTAGHRQAWSQSSTPPGASPGLALRTRRLAAPWRVGRRLVAARCTPRCILWAAQLLREIVVMPELDINALLQDDANDNDLVKNLRKALKEANTKRAEAERVL